LSRSLLGGRRRFSGAAASGEEGDGRSSKKKAHDGKALFKRMFPHSRRTGGKTQLPRLASDERISAGDFGRPGR
jgi:hypothetical protein